MLALMADRVRHPSARITESDIADWSGRDVEIAALHDAALAVARGYRDGQLTYEVADAIMNDLWPIFLDRSSDVVSPFWDVFEAFDAGEYHRCPDRSDDPVVAYTDPMIAELLARYPGVDRP